MEQGRAQEGLGRPTVAVQDRSTMWRQAVSLKIKFSTVERFLRKFKGNLNCTVSSYKYCIFNVLNVLSQHRVEQRPLSHSRWL